MKLSKKKIFAIIVILIIIVLVAIFLSITGSSTVKAQLNVEQGSVSVNGNIVSGNVILKEGDVIETSENGLGTVILYESIVINLEPSTKIRLDDLTKEHPKISQESGETWNKFTKIAGVAAYTVNAGNSVASVRGTSFYMSLDKIIVGEGEVDYQIDGQKFTLTRDRVVERIDGRINERDATTTEKDMIRDGAQRVVNQLKNLREMELEKHPTVVGIIKNTYDLTDEDIRRAFEDADEGRLDIDELKRKSPIDIASVEKIADITREIRKIKQDLAI